jgi:molybdopterin-guanine dinucleotide biosynthesis protein A
MGRDKATLRVDPADACLSLSARTAALLKQATELAVEVGPGHTDLPRVAEAQPGRGPLAALVAGRDALAGAGFGWCGPLLVVATDLPRLTLGLLGWLVASVDDRRRSVVPVDEAGRAQLLCACYTAADLDVAGALVADGKRAMRDLLERTDPVLASPSQWTSAAGSTAALVDIDTPTDLERLP